ncbi:MAG TPA: hypothetical protein VGS96_00490 [Thermoanaerobaculia bacterium]|jgi:hypothetical protein|nr:hypothetical protein [Thermoanaerobaculia bacterium]
MSLFLDLLFGSIGGAYLIYGKRQHSTPFLVAGFILVIYPYFVSSLILCGLIGVVMIATPFVVRTLA